jgi:hypothetical protein
VREYCPFIGVFPVVKMAQSESLGGIKSEFAAGLPAVLE